MIPTAKETTLLPLTATDNTFQKTWAIIPTSPKFADHRCCVFPNTMPYPKSKLDGVSVGKERFHFEGAVTADGECVEQRENLTVVAGVVRKFETAAPVIYIGA